MLCERSYDPLSRMLLKGDEGGAKFGGGGRKWRFSPGIITPWEVLALRVTGIVPLPLSGPVHSAIHERPSPAGTRSAPQARTIPRATQHLLTPRGKIKNGRAHAVYARARSPDRAHDARSSHFGLVPRGAPGGTFVTYNRRTFAEGAAPMSKMSLIT